MPAGSALRGRDRSGAGDRDGQRSRPSASCCRRNGPASNGNGARPENGRCWHCLKPNLADHHCCLLLRFSLCAALPAPKPRRCRSRPRQQLSAAATLAGNCQPRRICPRTLRPNSISITARRWPSWDVGTMPGKHSRRGARLGLATSGFPLELAGVAFKQKRYAVAARHLRRALHLDPSD